MKAMIQEGYGSPDILRIDDVDRPVPKDNQVLVRVHAASLNAGDWRRVRGDPFLVRAVEGLRTPKKPMLGGDAAGVVESVGRNVKHVQEGERVFGVGVGSLAEYTVGRSFVPIPGDMTFGQAACLPIAGLTALQGLRDKAKVQAGQKVLVLGAGGGVGIFTVQIAKALGADVTGVTSTDKMDMVSSLGADRVIDYTRESFTDHAERYDAVIDLGGTPSLSQIRRVMVKGGRLILVGAGAGRGGPIGRMAAGAARGLLLRQRIIPFIAKVNIDDLLVLKDMVEAGQVRSVIEKTYPFIETAGALDHLETQKVAGKLAVVF